jgi:hypothetical protein
MNESLAGDLGSSNTVKQRRETRSARWPLVLAGVLGVAGGAAAVVQFYQPKSVVGPQASSAPSGQARVPVAPASTSASAVVSASAGPAGPEGPRWLPLVTEGQARVLEGNLVEAAKRFKEGKAMLDHVTVARENQGSCRLGALARVRAPAVASQSTGSPVLARTPRGLLVLWSDDHETVGHDHVFAQLVDEKTLKPEGNPVDVTPEAERVGRFAVVAQGQRVALLYANRGGAQQGMFLRWLEADGSVAAGATQVAGAKAAGGTPVLAVDKESVWGSWEEQAENSKTDLVLAGLSAGAAPVKLTDLKLGCCRSASIGTRSEPSRCSRCTGLTRPSVRGLLPWPNPRKKTGLSANGSP